MAWTTPRTWTTGEVVTAATMNTHVRDNLESLKAVGGDFVRYGNITPTTDGSGNVTVTFSTPFTTSCVSVVAMNGDVNVANWSPQLTASPSTAGFTFRAVLNATGAGLPSAAVRILYIALGT